ncbi:MAG: hypothetical protein ACTSUK_05680 [Promethearchaeota archaeon]
MSNYILNAVPLEVTRGKDWQIHEIEVDNWDKNKDFTAILGFKRAFLDESYCVETHGRLLIIIPLSDKQVDNQLLSEITSQLKTRLGKNVSLQRVSKLKFDECDQNSNLIFIKKSFVKRLKSHNLIEEKNSEGNIIYISRLDSITLFQIYLADVCYKRKNLTSSLTNQIATIFSILIVQYFDLLTRSLYNARFK